jgi:glycosyltransferase involved in cell wall biosynthesis
MKILQLTNKPPWPPHDGGAIAVLNLTTGLSGCGHQVTVLAMNTSKHHVNPDDIPEDIRQTANFRFAEVPATISASGALTNLFFSGKPYTAARFISDNYRRELKNLLRSSNWDIIQLEGTYLCPYIPEIRQNSKALIAFRAHNIESEIWERSAAAVTGWKKIYFSNLSRRIRRFEANWMNSYDLLIPITERDGDHFSAAGNQKPVMVIPGGFDFSRLGETSGEAEHNLFHIGSLDWMPNQEGLLWFVDHCWDKISRHNPGLTFLVAGRNAPEWLISRLNRPGILFCGEVTDARSFIRSNGIMVVPLLSGSGMRIKIIEGMALGKAIVTTPTGAEGVPVTHGENIMLAHNPEEFIRNLEDLIQNKALIRKMGENAMEFARNHFDHLLLAEKLTRFYHQYSIK